ncbi:MAG: hypothetical protein OXT03_00235, partial [Alphaproteobacteria bacterium]|nr:hypothetical protein [Alphaproteobacteria bacterium]
MFILYLPAKWQQRLGVCLRASGMTQKVMLFVFLLVWFASVPLGLVKLAQAQQSPAAQPNPIESNDGRDNPPILTERLQEVSQLYLGAYYEQAKKLIDILDRDYPNMVSVKILQARILFALGELQEAEIIADWLDKGESTQSKQVA